MQKSVIALVGLLFLPMSTFAPVAEARTVAQVDDGDVPLSPVVVAKVAPTPLTVRLTSYNAVPEQTDGDPTVTASGIPSNPEVIAARSQDMGRTLPFGTIIAIYRDASDTPGCNFNKVKHLIGYRVIADTMNARFTKRVDVEFDPNDKVMVGNKKMNPAVAMGLCKGVTVQVVGRIPLSQIPATQEELQKMVVASTLALNS